MVARWRKRTTTQDAPMGPTPPEFGGFTRLDEKVIYDTFGGGGTAEVPRLRLYVPSRTALVLARG